MTNHARYKMPVMSTKDLAKAFWSGKRWLVSLLKGSNLVERLFLDYGSADSYCVENELYDPCITCLSSLLKQLNGVAFNVADEKCIRELSDSLSIYPLISGSHEDSLSVMLATGEYVPCYWHQSLHPLTSISEYQLYVVEHAKDIFSDKRKPASVHASFAPSMEAFKKLSARFASTSKLVVLSGTLGTHRYVGKQVLYTCLNGTTEIAHDITEPFILSLPVFARYQVTTKCLLFFDGRLHRILPQKLTENYNFIFFNFDILR